jgi:dTDP-4-amino-4,6-dideoxygalactose transaminase
VDLLRAEGMVISGYYAPPLYRDVEPRDFRLPVAEWLAERHLQLPVGEFVAEDDVAAICGLLRFIAAHGAEIADRLTARGVR